EKRWQSLLSSLKKPRKYCILLNKYSRNSQTNDNYIRIPFLNTIPCYITKELHFPPPEKDINQIYNYHLLDAASVIAVEALDIQPNDKVLDLCSAPGGKSIAIAQLLSTRGLLHCNEFNQQRRKRLQY